jgi:formate/nitrite transporter FocA (FNT family)
MSAPEPHEIYQRTKEEGRRRLNRPFLELVSTAIAAGVDVAFGIIAIGTISSLLSEHFGPKAAHVGGAIGFGIAFVFIVIGRSELFTENFLVPVAGLERNRASWLKLLELWTISPIFNILGGFAIIAIVTTHGVLPEGVGVPIVDLADKLDHNGWLAAFMSAIAAGALITMMTWFVEGAETMGIRVIAAWITGALLTLGAFNHVIVVTLEMFFGIRYGSTAGWGDLVDNFFTALLGNFIGGVLFVTLNRTTQAKSGGGGGE